ncbi:MAG: hypothetical protein RL653_923 [Pseudomonadota bacterium]
MRTLTAPPAPLPETVIRRPPAGPVERQFVDDITLFCVALTQEPEQLLSCLESTWAQPAVEAACAWRRVASGERHAALARRFGPGPDSAVRLQQLLEQSGPELQRAVVPQLPAWLRHVSEGVEVPAVPPVGLRKALAARIVKESLQPPPSRTGPGPSGGSDGAAQKPQ